MRDDTMTETFNQIAIRQAMELTAANARIAELERQRDEALKKVADLERENAAQAAALIREQEQKIKRMAEALRDAEAYIRGLDSVNGPCLADMKERHADALRDAGVSE